MNIENLKSEFYKQTNTLLEQLSTINENIAEIVKNYTLDDSHIQEINNNISPYINDIITLNYKVFEENNIELIKDINLSELLKTLDSNEKNNICKYLQTIYLIINTYDKENRTSERKKYMKQIKTSLTTVEEPDNTIENTPNIPNNNTEKIDEMCDKMKEAFGSNSLMNNVMDMTKKMMSNPNIDMSKLMGGDSNELQKMMANISNMTKEQHDSGELNMDNINNDAMDFLKNMTSGGKKNIFKTKPQRRRKKK